MVNVINPKVSVIDYGPELKLENRVVITSDDFVCGSAQIAYRDTGVLQELMDIKSGKITLDETQTPFAEKIKTSLIKAAGSGHASMATTPGIWLYLEGNCSKMVDSIFSGARFASFIMPSGRRVPVAKPQIVVPQGIVDRGFTDLYVRVSERNIDLYEKLQEQGVQKEEAAKIVQYGHRGGGFAFMPLETLICVSRNIKEENSLIPGEAKEIVKQLENFIYAHRMGITYEARSNAPRTGCPNPNIFHNRKNLARELIENNYGEVLDHPVLLSTMEIPSEDRDRRIADYLQRREKLFATKEGVESNWRQMLRELELIVEDSNDSVSVKTVSNSPWRVWGEVKRHRTLGQTTESVYSAVNRAINVVNSDSSVFGNASRFAEVVSLPPQIEENRELLMSWIEAFSNSVRAYEKMVIGGVKESDAILVVPRGLKFGIVKTYDFYNLTTGMMSLRLCSTCEPEMRKTTEKERELVMGCFDISASVKQLITPKCIYVGFCTEDKYCGRVNQISPFYNADIHKAMKKSRESEIRSRLV